MEISEAVDSYLAAKSRLSPRTQEWYQQKLVIFTAWCEEQNLILESLRQVHIRKFLDDAALRHNPYTSAAISSYTLHGYAQVLKGFLCRRCGISRPTLRLWVCRYEEQGPAWLVAKSHRPHTALRRKVFEQQEQWILELRQERNLGARRIQHELQRLHQCPLSPSTIQRVLRRQHVAPLRRHRRPEVPRRYSRQVPGACVQMDTIKIAPGLYQYTAIDDCSRYLVLALFPHRTAANTLRFLEQVLDELPFPIQRLQTDNGTEFTAYAVQDFLLENAIKFQPIPRQNPSSQWESRACRAKRP
jgi:transposase